MTQQNEELVDSLNEPRLVEETGVALRIAGIVTPVLRDFGFRLVRIKISGAYGNTLQVMAERPDGTFSIEDCETISKALSPVLDLEDPIASAYRLEVSSPGIDRPLVRLSDFQRNIGNEAKIELSQAVSGRRRLKGTIVEVLLPGSNPKVALREPNAKVDSEDVFQAPVALISDARLVLNDALVRQSLRAAKKVNETSAKDQSSAGLISASTRVSKSKPAPSRR